MKVLQELTAIADKSWQDGAKDGYLAVLDPEGNWTPESVFVFKDENKDDAKKCEAFFKRLTKGQDTLVKLAKVDGVYIVLTYDHRADMDEVHILGFDQSHSSLEERLRKDVEDDDLNIDVDMFDELVQFTRVSHSGKVA
jgi:hypothetical protein